jgi:predicted transcriptional regulator of viral defense system
MEWESFLKITRGLPLIDTENVVVGSSDPASVQVQISRWHKAGKIIQLKKGIYLLAEPYRKIEVYEPYLAAVLKRPSYISLEKALEYHNVIPEAVSVYTSVTTKRGARFESEAGIFDYKHIQESLFWGYASHTVNQQTSFIAVPEKALLDFFYLKKVKISLDYLIEMRLQNLASIDIKKLEAYARRFAKPAMMTVAAVIKEYAVSAQTEKVL